MWQWLAQVAVDETLPQGAPVEGEAARPGGLFSGLGWFFPLMLIVFFVYMIMMGRPGQKDQARVKQMLANLKKNDRVVTAGGIVGTVINIREDTGIVTLRIDEATNAKLQILRASIVRVLADEDAKSMDKAT